MIVGYDPARVSALAGRSREALWALTTITSTEPAASSALDAVRRLHRTIESGVLAAADDIIRSAPLTSSSSGRAPSGVRRRRRRDADAYDSPTSSVSVADLFHDLARDRLLGELAELTDEELIELIDRMELEFAIVSARYEQFDVLDPDWLLRSEALGIELARRTGDGDTALADQLIDRVPDNPLLALVIARSPFGPEVKVRTLDAVVGFGPLGGVNDSVWEESMTDLLAQVLADPAASLAAIATPGLLAGVLRRSGPSDLAVLVEAGLVTSDPFDVDPTGTATARALAALTAFANSSEGERGLHTDIAVAYAAAVGRVLPRIVSSFDGRQRFFLVAPDGRRVPIRVAGDTEEVHDLLGVIVREPEALALLLAEVSILAATPVSDDFPLYETADVHGLVVALGGAAANEQAEELVYSQRTRDRLHSMIDAAAATATGVLPASGGGAVGVVVAAGHWVVDLLGAPDDLGMDDVPRLAEILFTLGIASQFVALHPGATADEERDDPAHLLDEISDGLADDIDLDSLDAATEDLRESIEGTIRRDGPDARGRRADAAAIWRELDPDGDFSDVPFVTEPVPDAE